MDIVSGATSLATLRSLVRAGVQCRSFSGGGRLHAKVYIFGDECAVVTSANLTKNALDSNIEVGIRVTGSVVQMLANWFDTFWSSAARIDLRELSEWAEETAALRRAYTALRRRAGDVPRRRSEAVPIVRSESQFRKLFKTAPRVFVCNTNRRHSPDGADENLMRRTQYAAVWTEVKYPTHMRRVAKGDAIFMFAKGAGIIGVGLAKAGTEILPPGDPDRITSEFVNDEEWRVPVDDWLAWIENDAEAYPWKMPNASFLDVSGDDYRELREGVSRHFLRSS
jgi:phosphatidylserine/phosphatidylglycerophosphate/cardiolipin synthase-like enzyme